jgi:hypothetical protein
MTSCPLPQILSLEPLPQILSLEKERDGYRIAADAAQEAGRGDRLGCAHAPLAARGSIALLTAGMTCSAISSIERRASRLSIQSWPA